jgi:hypothetical protein
VAQLVELARQTIQAPKEMLAKMVSTMLHALRLSPDRLRQIPPATRAAEEVPLVEVCSN